MRALRVSVGVVRGEDMVKGRSGRAVVKRITSHRSSSGGGPGIVVFAQLNREAAELDVE